MTVKLTLIYGNPQDEDEFERHYRRHQWLIAQLPNLQRAEFGRVFCKEDGSPRPRWRTADLYFADYNSANAVLSTPEGKAFGEDTFALATGGIEFLLSDVEA